MEERNLASVNQTDKNIKYLKKEISGLIPKAKILNNYDWMKKIDLFTFLREYGKQFNISYLLNKESVKRRIDKGLSYAEFTYTIFQAVDYLHLYQKYGCNMQFGGSDQWGNIASGLDLIKKKEDKANCFALITDLLLDENGNKYGKSAGNAIFLNAEMTSPYEMYQQLFNTTDLEIMNCLKWYTFLTEEEINALAEKVEKEPHLREAQKVFAKELVIYVHGEKVYQEVMKMTDALFNGDIKKLSAAQIDEGFKDVPHTDIEGSINIVDLIVKAGAASSKREAREFIKNGAILINSDKIVDSKYIITIGNAIENKFIVIKRGKRNYYLARYTKK